MPTQTTLLTIIVFIVQIISHVKATISNTKLIKFNREYGFNLTANELKGVFGFSASGEALSVTSVPNGPSMNQLEQVQTNDVLVSINGGQSVHPTDIMDALKDLDELLSFLRKSQTAGMIFPRLLDSKLDGFVEMRWIDVNRVQIQPQEKTRQDDIRNYRNEEALRKARELEEERQRARRLSRESKYINITTVFSQDKPPPHIEFEQETIPLMVSKDVKINPPLKKGDELVLVNEESVLELETFNDVFQVIKNALWPKTLLWRRRKPLGPDDIEQQLGVMQVLSPEIAEGCFPYRLAEFGELPSCGTYPLYIASDRVGCTYFEDGIMGRAANGSAVIVQRGYCSFGDKIKYAQHANAAVLLIVNSNFELLSIPSNSQLLNQTKIPVAMISSKDGSFLMSVVDTLHDAHKQGYSIKSPVLRVGDPDICRYPREDEDIQEGQHMRCPKPKELSFSLDQKSHMILFPKTRRPKWHLFGPAPKPVIKSKVGKLSYLGGKMQLWNGRENIKIPYLIAMFGFQVPNEPRGVVVAKKDKTGCKNLQEVKLKNLDKPFVLVERGVCQFTQKAQIAEKFGASVVIVLSHDDNLFRLPSANVESEKGIKSVASIMIRKSDSDKIKDMLESSDNAVARFYPNTEETAEKP